MLTLSCSSPGGQADGGRDALTGSDATESSDVATGSDATTVSDVATGSDATTVSDVATSRDAALEKSAPDAQSMNDAAHGEDVASRPDAVPDSGSSVGVSTARPLGTTAAKNGFWEYLPGGYGDGAPRPLLVFWHGIGENGAGDATELKKVNANGPPKLIAANQWPAARPFVVLSPQHAGGGCPASTEIHDFITFALGAYTVDPKRVYLTGLSCGALGSAGYLGQYGAEQVVAAALIAGDATPIWQGQGCALLGQMGLWAFHGDADPTVNIAGDNTAMPKYLACPAPRKDVQYTVYPGVGHDSWSRTYDLSAGHDIYAWLLGFTR
jgi:predicted esterase